MNVKQWTKSLSYFPRGKDFSECHAKEVHRKKIEGQKRARNVERSRISLEAYNCEIRDYCIVY